MDRLGEEEDEDTDGGDRSERVHHVRQNRTLRSRDAHRIRRGGAAAGILFAVVLVGVEGCRKPSDPVRAAIDRIAAAAEDRNAGGVLENVAADFQAADGTGRPDAEATLRRYLAAYESLDVEISDLTMERAAGAARARFTAKLSGSPRKIAGLEGIFPRTSSWRFDVRFAPDADGRWLLTWAAWEQTE